MYSIKMSEIALYGKDGIVGYTTVDSDDYEKVNKFRWNLDKGNYAVNSKIGRLHRFIMGANKEDLPVDHINCDKLNNTKANLRFATNSQNSQNKTKIQNTTSKFIGVSSSKDKWRTNIRINRIKTSFTFDIEDHAAFWYDILAVKHYGKNAKINNVDKPDNFIEPVTSKRVLPTGVNLHGKKYQVQCQGKCLGTYSTISEAEEIYVNYKKNLKTVGENIILKNDNEDYIIKTKSGNDIIVDIDKYSDLSMYTWYLNKDGYATGTINNSKILMHRYIIAPDKNQIIDHINHNRIDNRVSNLRISDNSRNSHNVSKQSNVSSIYKGVSFRKDTCKYQAYIAKDGKRHVIGCFLNEIEAAKAYNDKAIELYGTYANLNIISISEECPQMVENQ